MANPTLSQSLAARGVPTRPPANLRKWRLGLGRVVAGAGNAYINSISDSTAFVGSGSGATGADGGQPKAVAANLAKLLNSYAGRSDFARSDGYWGNHFSSGGNLASFLLYDTRWSMPGWSQDAVYLAGGSLVSPAANTQPATFQPVLPYDRATIIYRKVTNGGTLTVASASGGSGNIATNAGAATVNSTTINLTRGAGLLSLTPAASTAGIYIVAVEVWDSTVPQVIVRDIAWSGASSSATSFGLPNVATTLALLPADMSWYSLGVNDAADAALDAAAFAARYQAFLGVGSPGSIGVVIENESSDAWNANATVAKQRQFADALRGLVTANGYASTDLPVRWGDYATAQAAGYMFNDPHPNAAAYGDKALAMAEIMRQ